MEAWLGDWHGAAMHQPPTPARGAAYADPTRSAILSDAALARARAEIASWPGHAPTPLRALAALARASGLAAIDYKDEGGRFGLGSFKALGGAYAVLRLLRRRIETQSGARPTTADIRGGRYAAIAAALTVTCATDGNHGRSVAWGAQLFGCPCVIYVHETVSAGRCEAIARYGATVVRVAGTYDDAVRRAAADAAAQGWQVVSDTSYPGYVDVPRDVMQGYGVMVAEALEQMGSARPTHVFVQGGVGGLAAAVCATLWERLGDAAPRFIVVEPERARCLYLSAIAGHPVVDDGPLDTLMAGLACGEVSLLAWEILKDGADAFMTIPDAMAIAAMRLLAAGRDGDPPIVAGESAVAGLAGLLAACSDDRMRAALGLDAGSRVLLFGTEGATDPALYAELVGRAPEAVAS